MTLAAAGPGGKPARAVRWGVALGGALVAGVLVAGPVPGSPGPAARASLAIAALAVGLWGSELIPMPLTAALALILLAASGAVARRVDALDGLTSPVLFFLLGTAGLGIAAQQTGLANRMVNALLGASRRSGRRLLLGLLASLPLQPLIFPSAITRNVVLVPVYQRILDALHRPPRLGAAIMLTLGVLGPLASSVFLTGGIAPVAAQQAIGGFTWFSWFITLAVPYYAVLALGSLLVFTMFRPEPTGASAAVEASSPPAAPRFSGAELRLLLIGAGVVVLWLTDGATHWSPAVPALLALAVMLLPGVGVMSWKAYLRQAPWGIAWVLAAAVSLGHAVTATGAAAWLAGGLFHLFPAGHGPGMMALAIYAVTALITLAIPNRAAAVTLCIPLATAYAATGALPAVVAGLIVLVAVDVESLYPAQAPAGLLAFQAGYFSAGQLVAFNLALLALGALVVLLVGLPWWSTVLVR
ncbi:MAG TPA: SLC13 family permease [Candidatus Limnocylindrales bacterium]|nr:SLC13 family permease [Candidatus Limnocylindrales bacterium]